MDYGTTILVRLQWLRPLPWINCFCRGAGFCPLSEAVVEDVCLVESVRRQPFSNNSGQVAHAHDDGRCGSRVEIHVFDAGEDLEGLMIRLPFPRRWILILVRR